MKNKSVYDIVWISAIAAIYFVITVIFAPVSYGPIQVRISESLTLLPFFEKNAIWGLFIGCLLANIFGGIGIYDIIGGSLLTLLAGFLTYKMRNIYIAGIMPIIVNAFGVSFYISLLFKVPYWITVLYIGIGETIAVYGIGLPFFLYLRKFYKSWRLYKW